MLELLDAPISRAIFLWIGTVLCVVASIVAAKFLAGRLVYRGAGPKHGGTKHLGRLTLYLFRNLAAFAIGAGIPSIALAVVLLHSQQFFLSDAPSLMNSSGENSTGLNSIALFILDQALKGGLNDFAEVFGISVSTASISGDALGLKDSIMGYRLLLNAVAFFALWRVFLCVVDLALIWAKRPADAKGRNRFNFTRTSRGYVTDDPELFGKVKGSRDIAQTLTLRSE